MPTLPAVPDIPAETVARLYALSDVLYDHGWRPTVEVRRGLPPTLHARNPVPGAGALSDYIQVKPGPDGIWTYWWSWSEQIARTPADAAAVIVRVLRPAATTITKPESGQPTAPGPDLETALRDAEQFLIRTSGLHPDLTAQTLLRCLHRYRAHLHAVVTASRRQPESIGT